VDRDGNLGTFQLKF